MRPLLVGEQPTSPTAAAVMHYVTDEEMLAAGRGRRPRALCGRVFVVACLVTPLGRTCAQCAALRRPDPTRTGRRTRSRALRRLLTPRTRRNP